MALEMRFVVCCLATIISAINVGGESVTDETKSLSLHDVDGIVAGYGDFNADKDTDIFLITNGLKTLRVYTWDSKNQKFRKSDAHVDVTKDGTKIVNVSPADFNNDGDMDVLVTMQFENSTFVSIVYLGNRQYLTIAEDLKATTKDQPSVLDVNGDYLPDLFGTNSDGKRVYWIYMPAKDGAGPHFSKKVEELYSDIAVPNSNGFVDATGDMHPELVVKSIAPVTKKIMFEVWQQVETDMSLVGSILFGIDAALVGQSSFVDIDADGTIDLVIPVCMKDDCLDSRIYSKQLTNATLHDKQWKLLLSNQNENWQFNKDLFTSNMFPTTLIFGDIIMDGNIDAVTILQKKDETKALFVAQLINQPCKISRKCDGSRTLQVVDVQSSLDKPLLVSLFDIFENGVLDLVITYQRKDNPKYFIMVLHNNDNVDLAFLKVAVLTGDSGSPKFGSNIYGAMVKIQTTNTDGDELVGKAGQWTQNAYFALQPPYVVFGLGRSPNFVEKLTVGVPKGSNEEVDRVRSWTAIIPNAQVMVIPTPKDHPSEWVTKLLVAPSKLLLQTGGVLVGLCLLISGVILILHIKEKREDEREKRKESHKFHFDAL